MTTSETIFSRNKKSHVKKKKKKKKVYEELIFCQSFLVHGQSKTTKGLYILID